MWTYWSIVTPRFQSTYLYKVRPLAQTLSIVGKEFQSTYLYKVRPTAIVMTVWYWVFQSTYLYKVRHMSIEFNAGLQEFQSTYLYKVRLIYPRGVFLLFSFNPRTYIRYDSHRSCCSASPACFNPRTYIRYDTKNIKADTSKKVSIHVPI